MITLIILTATGLAGMFSEIFRFRKMLPFIMVAGLAAAFAANCADWNTGTALFNNMMVTDNFAVAFTALLIGLTFIWFFMSGRMTNSANPHSSDHSSLILFALIGGVAMTSFNNMIMLFLGIEILSIAMYILAGSSKQLLSSNEAALKYFLMGAFATGFLLFGIAMLYGATGSFYLNDIGEFSKSESLPVMFYAGLFLMLVGLAFKVSAVPFHFWTPDVYHGSPTEITAFMASVVKTAAFAALFRVFYHCFPATDAIWSNTVWAISALSIIIGNLLAIFQQNVKRMLAYSSISHAGYLLMAVLALEGAAASSLLFYATAYSVASIASFALLLIVSQSSGSNNFDAFQGLAGRSPMLAIATVIAALSLAGIPPAAGFFAKYYVFSSVLSEGYTGLVIIAVAGSLMGVYYYFRLIFPVFRDTVKDKIAVNPSLAFVIIITAALTLMLGLAPGLMTNLLR